MLLALNALPVHLLRQVSLKSLEGIFLAFVLSQFLLQFPDLHFGVLRTLLQFCTYFEVIWRSFWLLFQDKVDLQKHLFYLGKTLLFEVWEGPGS